MNAKILIADDDIDLLDVLTYVLRRHQFQVVTATNGQDALERFERDIPDLIILDVNMPGTNGFEVCRRIRTHSSVPIIMLTVRSEDADVVGALRLGADDYVTKPFSTSQLVARVEALLRRVSGQLIAAGGRAAAPAASGLRLDLATHTAHWRGRRVPLEPEEYRILDDVARAGGQAVAIADLVQRVWGPRGGSEELLKVHLRRLREKLEDNPDHPRVLRLQQNAGQTVLTLDAETGADPSDGGEGGRP
jgi:DNA-binding response OmpR family regulator